jgi:hypothetical protein
VSSGNVVRDWSIATAYLWVSAGKPSGRLFGHLGYDLYTTRLGGACHSRPQPTADPLTRLGV